MNSRLFLYVPGNLGDIVIFAAAFNALSLQPVNVVFLADSVSTAYLLQSLIGHNPVSCLFLEFSRFTKSAALESSIYIHTCHPVISIRAALKFLRLGRLLITPLPSLNHPIYILPRYIRSSPGHLPYSLLRIIFSVFYTSLARSLFGLFVNRPPTISYPFSQLSRVIHEFDFHYLCISAFSSNSIFKDHLVSRASHSSLLPRVSLECDSPLLHASSSSYLLLMPFASRSYREPTLQSILRALKICNSSDLPVVLAGTTSSSSHELYDQIINSSLDISLDLVNKTSLLEVIALMQQARVSLVADSFGLHLSVLSNTSTFLLAGGGHFSRFCDYASSVF